MPLTLDATVGGASANAYSTAANADLVASYRVGALATSWGSLTADQKVQALVTATRALDTVDYKGERATETQALEWPRTGTEYAADELPPRLVSATVELAFSYASAFAAAGATGDVLAPDTRQVKEKTIGPITTIYFDPPAAPVADGPLGTTGLERFPAIVQRLLAPLVRVAVALGYGTGTAVRAS